MALAEEEDMEDDLEFGTMAEDYMESDKKDTFCSLNVDPMSHRLSTTSTCLSSDKPKTLAKNVKVSDDVTRNYSVVTLKTVSIFYY